MNINTYQTLNLNMELTDAMLDLQESCLWALWIKGDAKRH